MKEGKIKVKKTATGFLYFGLGWSELYWEDPDGSEKVLLYTNAYFLAHSCPECGAVLADPKRTREEKPEPYVPENLF